MTGCTKSVLYLYEGDKNIVGNGGFYKFYIPSYDVGLYDEFPDGGVTYYAQGLPVGAKCKLLGYISSENINNVTKNILKLGGNVATQSLISIPVKFDGGFGIMDNNVSGNDTSLTNYFGEKVGTLYSYTFFNCK